MNDSDRQTRTIGLYARQCEIYNSICISDHNLERLDHWSCLGRYRLRGCDVDIFC
jgi:hypothetical protein